MKKSYTWILFLIFLLSCGTQKKDSLPIEQINRIKYIISQALYFGADKYSNQNYQSAVDSFLKAQNTVFEDKTYRK